MKLVLKSLAVGLVGIIIILIVRSIVDLSAFTSDLGGINNFIAIFGTLFGLLLAFIVFEVWNQYNSTSQAISDEASQIERLYRVSRYFRDGDFDKKFSNILVNYLDNVINEEFSIVAKGSRNKNTSAKFREISSTIADVSFDDDHDSIVFQNMLEEYSKLGELRNRRIELSLTRLPGTLKILLYTSAMVAVIIITLMPFTSPFYHFLVGFFIYMLLGMVLSLIDDLDNPFVGSWNLTTKDYERVKKNILEAYN